MSFLHRILLHKREEVSAKKKAVPENLLEEMTGFARRCHSLEQSLRGKQLAVIAEIKKASPSKGVIRERFDPLEIALEYVHAGASALSVLTDEEFFQGDLRFIQGMRDFVHVPILRKDIIIDPYQLCESKAYGADAVLLIAAALRPGELTGLLIEAERLGMESLVEVHSREEIESLNFSRVRVVGINNRDLLTFETDENTSFRLRGLVPKDIVVVSESGISSHKQIDRLVRHGIHAVLIGETFMRAESPGKALADLIAHVHGIENES